MTTQKHERIPHFTLGDRLRKARSLTGLTVAEFAELIGVSDRTINNAEGDKRAVRKITLNAWALATGVPLEWLETGADPAVSPPPHPEGETGQLPTSSKGRNPRSGGSMTTERYTHRIAA